MTLGFDWDELKRHWDGGIEVFKGNKIYNPFNGEYVDAKPGTVPSVPPSGGPNSVETRLAHVEALRANGVITDEEAAEARKRITSEL